MQNLLPARPASFFRLFLFQAQKQPAAAQSSPENLPSCSCFLPPSFALRSHGKTARHAAAHGTAYGQERQVPGGRSLTACAADSGPGACQRSRRGRAAYRAEQKARAKRQTIKMNERRFLPDKGRLTPDTKRPPFPLKPCSMRSPACRGSEEKEALWYYAPSPYGNLTGTGLLVTD